MDYSPKNRKHVSLPVLEIQIESAEGILITDPNNIALMASLGTYHQISPRNETFSEISGEPAYLIRIDDLELKLSFEEMDRFFRHDLTNEEFSYLLIKYGVFHEIHEDFYWNNEACQPIEIAQKTIERIKTNK